MFSFGANIANFLEMSPSARKTPKFIFKAMNSSFKPNLSQNYHSKPRKKYTENEKNGSVKFSLLSVGLAQIAVHVHTYLRTRWGINPFRVALTIGEMCDVEKYRYRIDKFFRLLH